MEPSDDEEIPGSLRKQESTSTVASHQGPTRPRSSG
ncbi:hypothetical protein F444_07535 [Phytophthora nicotianae P1976]|uniref:Uncharacterized protein n=1 Tax=Phytophthora nicotianae P1976 TaxID=1317066 RepID=A0A081AEC7_PHYNI|nr:hypothetical protein F444_07535 [Phytophthora nicotianae P1976]